MEMSLLKQNSTSVCQVAVTQGTKCLSKQRKTRQTRFGSGFGMDLGLGAGYGRDPGAPAGEDRLKQAVIQRFPNGKLTGSCRLLAALLAVL